MKFTALLLFAAAPLIQASPLGAAKPKHKTTATATIKTSASSAAALTTATLAKTTAATSSAIKLTSTTPAASSSSAASGTTASSSLAPGTSSSSASKTSSSLASGTSSSSSASASSTGKGWLGLSTGCSPKSCKTCKKDELSQRSEEYSLLPRAPATFEPADKSATGLNDWTKDVWAGTKSDLNINGGGAGETATSQLVEWKNTGLQFATVGGLYGCASVVVASTCGVYMSHHWGNPMQDEVLSTAKFMWDNEFTNPIEGLGKVTGIDQKALDAAYISQKELDAMYPSSGWTSLKSAASKCFGADKKPQAVIIVHNGVGVPTKHVQAGKEMAKIVYKMVPALGAAPEVVSYSNAADDAAAASSDTSDYHGKVIVSYDPSQPAYQVWMGGAKLTEAIMTGPAKAT